MTDLRPAVAEIERIAPRQSRWRKFAGLSSHGWTYAGVCGALFYVAFYLFSISQLVDAWRSGRSTSWDLFWHDPFNILLLYPTFVLFRFKPTQLPANPFDGWDRLAEAHWKALEDNGAHIPLAEPQPKPDPDDSPALAHRVLMPLTRPKRLRDSGVVALVALLIVVATSLGVVAVVLFFAWSSRLNPGTGPALLILTILTLCFAATAYVTLRWRPRTSAPISVTVDEDGLSWRETIGRHPTRHIAWREARAFVTFSWRADSTYTTYTVYALIAPGVVFTWELTQRATRKERHAHEELAGLIVSRAGLPLRTLTETFAAALAAPAAPEKPKIRFPLGAPGTPDAVPGIPAPDLTPEPPEVAARARRQRIRLRVLAAATVVPLLLLDSAGMYLQREQPHYFASYLARAEAQSPLYLDALNQDDNQWPVQHATSSNPLDFRFTEDTPLHGVYQLSGSDPQSNIYAWPGQPFANAIVEVTARQLHSPSDNASDGVGLVLRTSGNSNQDVEFNVDPTGYWDFADYSAYRGVDNSRNDIDGGESPAIHQGVGAVNRLSVVMRGNDFILYVNGRFLAVETDSGALASGPAGVVVESETTGGQFYDFAVYPLPADPLLLGWG